MAKKKKEADYKAIKIPKDAYDSLKDLKKAIIQKGTNSIDKDFANFTPKYCPNCKTKLKNFESKFAYYQCPKCGFKVPKINIGLGGSLALGSLIGLGVAGIIYLLTKDDKKPNKDDED